MAFERVLRGNIVMPDCVLADGYLAVRNGKIQSIGKGDILPAGPLDDHSGCFLFPGLIDAQVHAGSVEGIDGLRDATIAAAAGGVTTIVDMPFDNPLPVDSPEALNAKIEHVNKVATVDVALYATLPKDNTTDVISKLAKAGACAIKLSTYEYHPTRFPRSTMGEMYDAFLQAASVGLPVAIHNEDQEIVNHLTKKVKEAGQFGPETHAKTRPPVAEIVADAQVLELGFQTGARVHIVHSSVVEGFDMVDRYRAMGGKASAEVPLQYMIFNEQDVIRCGAPLKQTPPLRSEEQCEALWDALADDRVKIISTDHVAWPLSKKNHPDMFKNSSGVPGLESLLPILYTQLVKRDLSPTVIANVCGINVARHFGFAHRKGELRVGADADVAVLKPKAGTFRASAMTSSEKWSPYDGLQTRGEVAATYLRGHKIYADGEMCEHPSQGQFLRPER